MKLKKRILSAFLSVMMVVGIFPVSPAIAVSVPEMSLEVANTPYHKQGDELIKVNLYASSSEEVSALGLQAYVQYDATKLEVDTTMVQGVQKTFEAVNDNTVQWWTFVENTLNSGLIAIGGAHQSLSKQIGSTNVQLGTFYFKVKDDATVGAADISLISDFEQAKEDFPDYETFVSYGNHLVLDDDTSKTVTVGGTTATINIVEPNSVVLDESAVQVDGTDNITVNAAAFNGSCEKVDNPTFTVTTTDGDTSGVTVSENGVITVDAKAEEGTYTVSATDITGTATLTVTRAAAAAATVSVKKDGTSDSISVPTDSQTGVNTTKFTAEVTDQYDTVITNPSVEWSISPTVTGVSISNEDGKGKVSVSNDAKDKITTDGTVFTVTATCGDASDDATVTVKRAGATATTVEISGGATSLEIPADGVTENATTTFTATVKDQYGSNYSGEVAWSIADATAGVSINETTGVVTVTNAADTIADTQDFTVTATCGSATQTATLTVQRATAAAAKVVVAGGTTPLEIPADGADDVTSDAFTATVTDQYDDTMSNADVEWSIAGAPEGVSIDTNGVVAVSNEAKNAISSNTGRDFTVTATCGDASDDATVKIKRADPVATSVAFYKDNTAITSDTIVKPTTGTVTATYTARQLDQYGAVMNENLTISTTSATGVSFENKTVTVTADAVANSTITLTAGDGGVTASLTVTIVDIAFTGADDAVDVNIASPEYGATWADILTFNNGLNATLDGTPVDGTYTLQVNSADFVGTEIPNASETAYTYKVIFNSTDGDYKDVEVAGTSGTVTVARKPITDEMVATIADQTYTGSAITPELTVKNGTTTLAKDTDYTVTYTDNTDASENTATATITGEGNYSGTVDKTFNIVKADGQVTPEAGVTYAYTYGETMVITFTPAMASTAVSTQSVALDTATLSYNGTVIATVENVTPGTPVTFSVDTTADAVKTALAGCYTGTPITLAINWGGSANIDAADETVQVTLTAKTLTADTTTVTSITKEYDGKTDEGTLTGGVTPIGKIEFDDVTITATPSAYTDATAADNKTVTLTLKLEGTDAGYYELDDTSVDFTTAAITAKDVTATNNFDQTVAIGVGTFTELTFDGVNGEKVTGTTAYSYDGATTVDGINDKLQDLEKDATAAITYTLTANGNYTGTITGTINVTMVDILFTVGNDAATADNAVTIKATPTYGDTWAEIVKIGNVVAKVNGQVVKGTFSLNVTGMPVVGTPSYEVQFTSTDGKYDDVLVLSGSVTIAKREITITADNKYIDEGDACPTLTYTVAGSVEPDSVDLIATKPELQVADYTVGKTGSFDITFLTNAVLSTDAAAANYTLTQVDGTLYVEEERRRPSSGNTISREEEYENDVKDDGNGSVSLNKDEAEEGETVKGETKPDEGYQLADVIVTDEDGNEIDVTINEDGTFSFEQPDSEVEIEVIFEEITAVILPTYNDSYLAPWCADAIGRVTLAGWMQGVGNGNFAPNDSLNRAMMAQVVHNIFDNALSTTQNNFTDTIKGAWYERAVNWCVENGIFEGMGDGTFGTMENLTTQQMLLIFHRVAGMVGMDTTVQGDLSNYGSTPAVWATQAAAWADAVGLMDDMGGVVIDFNGVASRGMVAHMADKFYQLMEAMDK